jgi:phage FluMu protein Com
MDGTIAVPRETLTDLRCHTCNKLLAVRVTVPYEIRCVRCKAVNVAS